jgi:hypothetical protein
VERTYFSEAFSPIAKLTLIRFIFPLSTTFDLELEQMDVNMKILHGNSVEEISMKQPEGFTMKGKRELVFKMKKSLYGFKSIPKNVILKV